MRMHTTSTAALIGLAALLDPPPMLAGGPRHLTEVGLCRVPHRTVICICLLSSNETQMTSGEAASMVELFYWALLEAVEPVRPAPGGPPGGAGILVKSMRLKRCRARAELHQFPKENPARWRRTG